MQSMTTLQPPLADEHKESQASLARDRADHSLGSRSRFFESAFCRWNAATERLGLEKSAGSNRGRATNIICSCGDLRREAVCS